MVRFPCVWILHESVCAKLATTPVYLPGGLYSQSVPTIEFHSGAFRCTQFFSLITTVRSSGALSSSCIQPQTQKTQAALFPLPAPCKPVTGAKPIKERTRFPGLVH